MKVLDISLDELKAHADSLDLYCSDISTLNSGGYAFDLRPKGQRFRVDPLSDEDDYFLTCPHGHEALIRRLIEHGHRVKTVLAYYGPWLLEGKTWDNKQRSVHARLKACYPDHYNCSCVGVDSLTRSESGMESQSHSVS